MGRTITTSAREFRVFLLFVVVVVVVAVAVVDMTGAGRTCSFSLLPFMLFGRPFVFPNTTGFDR